MKRDRNKKNKKISFIKDIFNNPFSYVLLLPAVSYTVIFGYASYPYVVLAFQKFFYRNALWENEFVGFKNFEFFFRSNYASLVIFNTLKLNILFLIVGIFVSVTLAIVINELRSKWFVKISQSTLIFPHFISWVVVSYVLYSLLSTKYGVVNNILRGFGMEPVSWYTTAKPWTWILVIIKTWKGAGMSTIVYLAAIVGMDNSIFEAATIDGANRWQKIRYITLPLLKPTIIILLLLSIGNIMYGDFGMIYALIGDNGTLFKTTEVIDTYVFRILRLIGDPSQAMAISLFQSLVGFTFVMFTNWLTKRIYPDGALF